MRCTDVAANIGKSTLQGRVTLDLAGHPVGISGDVSADNVDGARMAALLLGLPSIVKIYAAPPPGAFAAVNGAVTFKFARADFTSALIARDLTGVARFGQSEIALQDVGGDLAGGKLAGALTFSRDQSGGVAARGRATLAGADIATLLGTDKNALNGALSIQVEGDSGGRSSTQFTRELHGSGTVSLANAQIAGLDTAAFEAAMRSADRSAPTDTPKILAAVSAAIDKGHLSVPAGDAAMTIANGKVSVANVTLKAQDGAELAVAGTLDLAQAAIDARLALSIRPPPAGLIGMRPELAVVLKGPLAAPQRTIDISALSGWLALRAAELQTRRLELLEANRRPEVLSPALRPEPPPIRIAPASTVIETEMTASAVPAARGFDRLLPEMPPDAARPDGPNADRGSAPAVPSAIKQTTPRPAAGGTAATTGSATGLDQNWPRPPAPPSAQSPAAPAAPPTSRSLLERLFGGSQN